MANIVSKIASLGLSELTSSLGGLAKDIREAITGSPVLDASQKAHLEEKVIELETMILTVDARIKEYQAKVVVAEIQGDSWLQRNWRPILMLIITAIVANNYLIFPYLSIWTTKVKMLTLPGGLFALLTTGVGGYVVGRSGEKIAERWRNGKK